MPLRRYDLHVPVSEDGRTTFAEVADILDHLATLYAWHPDAYGFLVTRASQARQIDSIYEQEGMLALKMVDEHRRANPRGCSIPACDVCASQRRSIHTMHTKKCRRLRAQAERGGFKFNSESDCLDPECPCAK